MIMSHPKCEEISYQFLLYHRSIEPVHSKWKRAKSKLEQIVLDHILPNFPLQFQSALVKNEFLIHQQFFIPLAHSLTLLHEIVDFGPNLDRGQNLYGGQIWTRSNLDGGQILMKG